MVGGAHGQEWIRLGVWAFAVFRDILSHQVRLIKESLDDPPPVGEIFVKLKLSLTGPDVPVSRSKLDGELSTDSVEKSCLTGNPRFR